MPALNHALSKLNEADLAKAYELEQQVLEVFAHTKRPDSINIGLTGTWYDLEGKAHQYDDPEAIEVGQLFANRHWRELAGTPLFEIPGASDAIGRMTPEAKAFFLPAYMISSIFYSNNWDMWNTDATVAPMLALIHPEVKFRDLQARSQAQIDALKQGYLERFDQFIALLSMPQKRVIRRYLDFMRMAYPTENEDLIDKALMGYWSQIDPN
jgi:hypothetical protein